MPGPTASPTAAAPAATVEATAMKAAAVKSATVNPPPPADAGVVGRTTADAIANAATPATIVFEILVIIASMWTGG